MYTSINQKGIGHLVIYHTEPERRYKLTSLQGRKVPNDLPDRFVFYKSVEGTRGLLGNPVLVRREKDFFYEVEEELSRGLVSVSEILRLSESHPILDEFAGNQTRWLRQPIPVE